jgi:serine/threonine protein kinase
MPAPTTNEELLELVRKSGVVDPVRLQAQIDRLAEAGQLPPDPPSLAALLVREGVLTNFQTEQFLQGKWRRFTIGKYKVLERLGAGGMGSVYLCEHMLMRRRVAVKVLPESKSDSSSLDRFYREARAVAALDHPNIVRAYDIDQDDKLHFLVMEHVDGASLQEIIKKTGPMDVLRATHYMRQAALGLQHAHDAAGLVHRDIKPGNILVDRNGIVKVLDMGLARFFHDDTDDLTKKYDENVLGTADYLAPEQALDSHTADIRADIYSLGGTFYYCLTGRPPFAEGSVAQKLIWHQTRNPKPIASLRPEVPAEIIAVIDKMMMKDKAARYQTPQEVADALAPFTQTPIPPPPDVEMPQFSPAARTSQGEGGTQSSSRKVAETAPAPPPPARKNWQVAPTTPAGAAGPDAPTLRSPAPAPRPSVVQATPRPPTNSTPARPTPAARAPASPAPAARAAAPATPPARKASRAVQTLPQPARVVTHEVTEEHLVEDEVEAVGAPRVKEAPRRARTLLETFRDYPPHVRWLLIAVAVLLPLCILLLYLLLGSGGKPAKASGREPIRVAPGPGALRQALRKAREGDHLLLVGDVEEADVGVEHRNLTLEAEPGKTITWRCPGDVRPDAKLLLVSSKSAGLQLRGVTLDGDNRAEALVTIFGQCPGVRLENLELKNFKKYGVLIMSGEGSEESPVELLDVSFHARQGQHAVRFAQQPQVATVKVNRYFLFKGCTFDGPGHKITTSDLACVDPATLRLPKGAALERIP